MTRPDDSSKDFPTTAPAVKPGLRLRPTRSLLALETRIVFDGALHAAVADPHETAAVGLPKVISGAAETARAQTVAERAPSGSERVQAVAERAPVDTTANAQAPTTILFIDASVAHPESLLAGLKPGVEVVMLDKNSDGVQQIAAALKDRHGLDSIQIVSEGNSGRVLLGSATLADSNIDSYQAALAAWGSALRAGGDILLFGCDVASTATGAHFVERMAALTGADVAASLDATGGDAAGGNWVLEQHTGSIEADKAIGERAAADYDGLLLTGNGTADGTYDFGGTLGAASGGFQTLNDKLLVSSSLAQDGTALYDQTATTDGGVVVAVFKAEGTTVAKTFTFQDFSFSVTPNGAANVRYFDQLQVVLKDINGNVIGPTIAMSGSTLAIGTNATTLSALINGGTEWSVANVASVTITASLTLSGNASNPGGQGTEINFNSMKMANISATVAPNTAPTFVGATTTLAVAQNSGAIDIRNLLRASDSDSGQTLTWSQATAPTRGTLTFSGATGASGSTDITSGGTITYTPTAGYAGTDTFTVQVSDGTASVTRTITVTVAPAAPGVPDLAAASDSGASNTDNITNATSLTFSGTSAAGDTSSLVRVFVDVNGNGVYDAGTDATATTTVNNGAWTATGLSTSGVADGTYNVYAVTTSQTGSIASTRSAGLAITLDKAAPAGPTNALTLTAASDSGTSSIDRITNVTNPTIRVNLAGTGAASGNTVELLLGAAPFGTPVKRVLTGTEITNGYLDVTLTSGALGADGSKTLTARVTDLAGNVGAAGGGVTITLDTTPPGAPNTPMTLSPGSDSGSTNTDNVTNIATPQVRLGLGGINAAVGDTIELMLNGAPFSTPRYATLVLGNINDGYIDMIIGNLGADGAKTISARVIDVAGNVGSAGGAFTFILDTTGPSAPTTPITLAAGSDTGSSNTDNRTNALAPTVRISLAGTGAAAGDSLELLLGGNSFLSPRRAVLSTTDISNGYLDMTLLSGALGADGVKVLTVRVTDAAGNGGATGGALTITLDTTPPGTPTNPVVLFAASDSGVSNSDGRTSVTNPQLRISLAGTGATAGDALELLLNGSAFATPVKFTLSAADIGNGYVDVTLTSGSLGADGAKVLTSRVTDIAGNVGAAGGSYTLTLDTTGPGAPTNPIVLAAASDSGVSNTDGRTNVTNPLVRISLAGTNAGAGDTLQVLLNGSAMSTPMNATLTAANISNGYIDMTVASGNLGADGTKVLTARISDVAGNVGTAGGALTIVLDTAAPSAPSTAIVLSAASDSGSSNSDGRTSVTNPALRINLAGTNAVSGDTVELLLGGAALGTPVTRVLTGTDLANGYIDVSVASGSLGADGSKTFTARVLDVAGNIGAAGGSRTIVLDTTAPGAPTNPIALAAASDSGSSNADRITNVTSPVVRLSLAGTGAASGDSVELLLGGAPFGTPLLATLSATNIGNGYVDLAVASGSLGADGVKVLTARVTDVAGNTGTTGGAVTITLDTTVAAPSAPALAGASDSGASSTDRLTNVVTPVLTGTAEPGSTVTLYDTDGTTVLGTGVATGGVWSIASSALADGVHVLSAKAVDVAGNTSVISAGTTITIDTTPPATPPAPTLDAASDNGTSGTDGITSLTTPVINGTATNGTLVVLYDTDGTTVLGTTVATGGAWSITTSALADGVHQLTVKARDDAGNFSAASGALRVTIAAPPVAPSGLALAAASDSGSSDADRITRIVTPTVTGTAANGTVVTLYDTDGTTVLGSAVTAGGAWSITSSALADGAHSLTARAVGMYGDSSVASSALAVTIDTSAPGAPTVATAGGLTGNARPTFSGSAEAGSVVTLFDTDGVTVLGSTLATGGAWTITSSLLADGAHALTVKAADAAGNASAASPAVSVTIDTTAPGAPAIATTSGVTNITTPVVNGTAEAGSTVTLYDTDGTTVLGTTLANGGAWSITSAVLAEGAHSLRVKATDAAGNSSPASSALAITIDTTAPGAPTVASPGGISGTAGPTLSGTAEAGSIVTLFDTDGVTVLGTTVATGGVWTITSSALADGAHALTVRATDAAGNTGGASAAVNVTIDTTAPGAPAVTTPGGLTGNARPTFSGTAEAGSTVTLFDTDGVTVLGSTVAIGGAWTITSSVLADGAHALTVKAVDAAGNVSAASSAVSVTIDTTAPGAPTFATTGGVTNITTPVVTGTAEAGSTVTLYDTDGATVLGTTVATGGTWSITSAVLAEGTHSLRVKAVDAAGNTSAASGALTLTIDTTAPGAPTVSSPGGISGTARPTLTGTAEAGSIVTLFDTDGVTVLGSTVATGGTWTITSNALGDGAHALTVRATDVAGNTGAASSAVNFTVDTTAPGAPAVTTPGGLTGNARPTFSGTAEAGSIVTLFDTNGTTVLGSTVATGGAWTITSSVLGDGAHALTVKAADAAGNTSVASAAVTVTIDTTAPGAPSFATTGSVTNVTTPVVTGTAEAGSTVTLYDTDGTTALGTTVATGGTWSITSTALAEGTHSLRVKAVDGAGNTSAASGALAITIDTTAPGAPTVASLGGISGTARPTLTGTAEAGSIVTLFDTDGVTVLGTTVATGGTWTMTSSALADGAHALTVKATDAAGNTGVASTAVNVTIDTAAPGAPTVTTPGGLTGNARPTFSGSAEAGSTVTLFDTNGTTVLGTTVAIGGVWTITSSALSDGAHALTVKAVDAAGNASAASTAVLVTVDTAAPGAPKVSTTGSVTNVTTPVVNGTAEAGSTVTLYDTDGTTVLGTTVATGGTWSITSTALAQGMHSLSVKAVDAAGNTSAASSVLALTIDTTAPGAPTVASTGGISGTAHPTLTGTAEAGSTVTLFDTDGVTVLGMTVATGGVWTITSSALGDGAHALTAKATDVAGNTGAASAAVTVTVDTTAPGTPTVTTPGSLSGNVRPTFSGTAEAGSTVTLFDTNGTTVLGTTVATGGVWTITSSVLGDGAHALTVKAVDAAGNASAASMAVVVTVDTAAPGAPTVATAGGVTNNIRPTITGTAEAGSTVTLIDTDGVTVLGTTVANGGVWSITSSVLAEGVHALTVKATDGAGNTSAASAPLAVTIDTSAPGTPVVASSGGLSSVARPTLSGTADTGSTITLFDTDGVTVLGTTIATGGAWSITSNILTDGVHALTVKATDAAGNASGASTAVVVTIDTMAPGAPAIAATTGIITPTLSGTAEAGSTITLYDTDGTTVLGTTVATGGTWSITSSTLTEGTHALTVKATDAAGNASAASAAVIVTVDTTAPGAPTVAPMAAVSNGARPTLTGTAEAGSTVTLFDTDGTTVLGTTVATSGAWSITSSTLADGAHTLTVKATDASGNTSAASAGVAVTIDTLAPDTPVVGTVTTAAGVSTPTFTGTAEAGSTITLYDTDGVTVLGTTIATGGTWTITSRALADGDHALRVTATDAAGNASAASAALIYSLDTTAPGAPVVATGGGTTGVTTPTFTGTAEAGSTVTLFDTDGVTVLGTTIATGGTWRITGSVLAEGSHALTVKATDTAGNTGTASAPVVVIIDTTAPAVPTVASMGGITNSARPTLSGTAETGSTVTLFDTDGTTVLGKTVATGGVWTITSSLLADGAHTLTVKATDAAGNTGPATAPLAVTIDTAAPGAPTVATTGGVTGGTRPTLSGTAETGSTVTLFDTDGVTVLGTTVATDGTWSITSRVLVDGAHALTVKATDAAGNTGAASAAVTFTVDTAAPAAPTMASTGGITGTRTPTITGTAESGSTVTLYDSDGSTVLGSTVANGGAWRITSTALLEGSHVLTVRAVDAAGNVSAASQAMTIVIDTTPPAAPGTPQLQAGNAALLETVPTLTGSAEANSTVSVRSNGTAIGAVQADASGTWRLTAQLSPGVNDITATATDAAGNTGPASAALRLNVLAPPPLIVTTALPARTPVLTDVTPQVQVVAAPVREATQGQASASPLSAAIQTAAPQTTASFDTAAALDSTYLPPAPARALLVNKDIANVTLDAGMTLRFVVPADTFVSADGTVPTLSARLADGRPLPAWIRFDPATGTFTGTPPAGVMVLDIEVVTKDANGNEVRSVFKVQAGVPQASLSGSDLLMALGLQQHATAPAPVAAAADAAPNNALSGQLASAAQRFDRAAESTLRHLANI